MQAYTASAEPKPTDNDNDDEVTEQVSVDAVPDSETPVEEESQKTNSNWRRSTGPNGP